MDDLMASAMANDPSEDTQIYRRTGFDPRQLRNAFNDGRAMEAEGLSPGAAQAYRTQGKPAQVPAGGSGVEITGIRLKQ